MYGGERKDPTPFMAEFREEFLTNATAVLTSEAFERYRTLAEAKKPANVLGCGISFVARLGEATRVLRHPTLQSKGYEVGRSCSSASWSRTRTSGTPKKP